MVSATRIQTLPAVVQFAPASLTKDLGAIFADMLNWLGVDRVTDMAAQDATELHLSLKALNATEHFARRAPTPEEVRDWVSQARALPPSVDG